jgi:hypothetical protein
LVVLYTYGHEIVSDQCVFFKPLEANLISLDVKAP